MPWVPDYNLLDADQLDFVDGKIDVSKLWLRGFAGTGKSVLLVHRLKKVFEDNPKAKCCVVSFTHALLEAFRLGFKEVGIETRLSGDLNICYAEPGKIDLVTKYTFNEFALDNTEDDNTEKPYDFVFFDEVQDVCKSDIEILANCGAEFIIAGDENQSIYRHDPQTYEDTLFVSEKGEIPLISSVLAPEEYKLTKGYRLTKKLLKCVKLVKLVLHERLIDYETVNLSEGGVDVKSAIDQDDEVAWVYDQAVYLAEDEELTAILFPIHGWICGFLRSLHHHIGLDWNNDLGRWFGSTTPQYNLINQYFRENNIKMEYVGNDFGSFSEARKNDRIIIMTWHSSKGMDFENVFIPFMSASRYPALCHNQNPRDEFFIPNPLMVALSRSNKNLTITYSGEPLKIINDLTSLPEVSVTRIVESDNNKDDSPLNLPF